MIRGCLEDLVNQTIFSKKQMEILVIDSCSEQEEGEIVKEFQNKFEGIRYIRTDKRENLYKSWNRAIVESKGEYLTNANTDDRHHPRCIEFLVRSLDENSSRALSYGNLYKSITPNEKFGSKEESRSCISQDFFPGSLLLHYPYGAQPLWRKSLHNKFGLFDDKFKVLGDFDFALRLVKHGITSIHVPKAVGSMLWHKNALSTSDQTGIHEKAKLLSNYRNPKVIESIYKYTLNCDINEIQNEALLDLGIRSLCYFPQFFNSSPQFDFDFAQQSFEQDHKHKALLFNLSSLLEIINCRNLPTAENLNNNLVLVCS